MSTKGLEKVEFEFYFQNTQHEFNPIISGTVNDTPIIRSSLIEEKKTKKGAGLTALETLLTYRNPDFVSAFLSVTQHILESPSIDTLSLIDIAHKIESASEEKKADILKQFLLDVQKLAPSTHRKNDQYQIYNKEINAFTEKHELLTQKEAFQLLKEPKDKSTSRCLNKLINEQKIFYVTRKSKGSDVAYPAFQFDKKTGSPKPIICKIITALDNTYSNWDLAFWFNSYNHDLGESIIEAMDKTKNHNKIISIAKNEARGDF